MGVRGPSHPVPTTTHLLAPAARGAAPPRYPASSQMEPPRFGEAMLGPPGRSGEQDGTHLFLRQRKASRRRLEQRSTKPPMSSITSSVEPGEGGQHQPLGAPSHPSAPMGARSPPGATREGKINVLSWDGPEWVCWCLEHSQDDAAPQGQPPHGTHLPSPGPGQCRGWVCGWPGGWWARGPPWGHWALQGRAETVSVGPPPGARGGRGPWGMFGM